MTGKAIIHLVDDDVSVLHSLSALIEAIGHECRCFESAEAFLEGLSPDEAGCVITDLQMKGMDGLGLQREMLAKRSELPLIIVSGQVSVAETVEFMENGAVTLLKKPYDHSQLIKAIDRALAINAKGRERRQWIEATLNRINELTADERCVMDLIVAGKANKVIASELHISMRTVDRRRSTVLETMHVATAPELAQLLTRLDIAQKEAARGIVETDQA